MSRSAPVFYGWGVVGVGFAVSFCVGGVMWSFGILFTSLEQEFMWSRSVVSGGYTLLILGHSLSAIIAGRLSDKNAARRVLLSSAVLAGVSIALCNQMHGIAAFYILFFLAGLGTGATVSVPTSTVVRWFENRPHSGTALAGVMAGVGLGSLVFAPLFRYFIASQGWRPTFVFAGIVFLVLVGGAGLLKHPYHGADVLDRGTPVHNRLQSLCAHATLSSPDSSACSCASRSPHHWPFRFYRFTWCGMQATSECRPPLRPWLSG